jgi:monoamine oxidase
MGGHWVGPHQRHVLDLAQKLGVEVVPQYHHGRKVRSSISRYPYAPFAWSTKSAHILACMHFG